LLAQAQAGTQLTRTKQSYFSCYSLAIIIIFFFIIIIIISIRTKCTNTQTRKPTKEKKHWQHKCKKTEVSAKKLELGAKKLVAKCC